MTIDITPKVGDVAHIEGDRYIIAEASDTQVILLDENYDRLLENIEDLDENHSKEMTKKAIPQTPFEKDIIEEFIIQDVEQRLDRGVATQSDVEILLDVVDRYRSGIEV